MSPLGEGIHNPGWAGETGEFKELSEADVRGAEYVGTRPLDGGIGGAVCSMPYMLEEKNPDAPLFKGPYQERLQKIVARYPNKMGALLPVLNLAQEIRGFVSPEAMSDVAETLELPPAYVRGVATFYSMYNRLPVGRYFIQVCTNVSCNLCGADDVVEALLEATDTEPGQTSADGMFTIMEAECLGACGFPTAVQINSRYFENIEAEDVPRLLNSLRSGHGTNAASPEGISKDREGEGASGGVGDAATRRRGDGTEGAR